MPSELDTLLRSGAQQVADATVPVPPHLIRARGDQRQRRQMAASTILAVTVIAAGAVAGAAGPAQPGRPGPRFGLAQSSLGLVAPAAYAPGVPNPVSFTISNPGRARQVTVLLDLGRPRYEVQRKAVVLRQDTGTRSWLLVPVVRGRSGWLASYKVGSRTGATVQNLLVVPAVPAAFTTPPAEMLQVSILSGGRVLGRQQAPPARLAPLAGGWRPPYSPPVARGQPGYRLLTLHNPASVGYRLKLFLRVFLCPDSVGTCSHPPGGVQIQWLDGPTWRRLGPAAYARPGDGQLLRTVPLRAHGTLVLRIRLIAGGSAPPSTGELYLSAQPDRASFPGPTLRYPRTSSEFGSLITTA